MKRTCNKEPIAWKQHSQTVYLVVLPRRDNMIRVNGKSVYRGIAVGPAVVLKNEDFQIKRRKISDVEAEY